jgi:hypothetical protein
LPSNDWFVILVLFPLRDNNIFVDYAEIDLNYELPYKLLYMQGINWVKIMQYMDDHADIDLD